MNKDRMKSNFSVWATAIAVLVFGLALLIWPGITTGVILNICGAALIVAGVYNVLVYFFRNKEATLVMNWSLGFGLILLLTGIGLIACKAALLAMVPMLFGIALLIAGIIKIQASCNLRRMGAPRWYMTMIGAAISVILGLLIILNPFGTGLMLIRIIGASIAFEAIQDLISIYDYKKTLTTYFVDK